VASLLAEALGIYQSLNNSDRLVDSRQYREFLGLSERTMIRYRKLCDVPSRRKWLTFRDVCALFACWELRTRRRRRRVTKALIICQVADTITGFNRPKPPPNAWEPYQGTGSGRDILGLPKSDRPSRSTLYRRGIQVGQRYNPIKIRQYKQRKNHATRNLRPRDNQCDSAA
jgi:hypothetical protein